MFLPLDLRDVDLCLEGILVDLDGLVSSSGRVGGLALLVAMEGRSEGVVSRGTEAGTVAVVPSRALGAGGSGSGGITEPGVWIHARRIHHSREMPSTLAWGKPLSRRAT